MTWINTPVDGWKDLYLLLRPSERGIPTNSFFSASSSSPKSTQFVFQLGPIVYVMYYLKFFCLSLSLSLSLLNSLIQTCTHTQPHTHPISLFLSLSQRHTLFLSYSHTLYLSHSLCHSLNTIFLVPNHYSFIFSKVLFELWNPFLHT